MKNVASHYSRVADTGSPSAAANTSDVDLKTTIQGNREFKLGSGTFITTLQRISRPLRAPRLADPIFSVLPELLAFCALPIPETQT